MLAELNLTWYLVSSEDRAIQPQLERIMAERLVARTVEIPSSHVAIISNSDATAALIVEAADSHESLTSIN